jgi:transposase InsO family protein
METWHKRLLHCSYDKILEMAKATRGIKISNPESKQEDHLCPTCLISNSKKNIGRRPQKRAFKAWEYIHLDAVGQLYPTGIWGEEWQITATDDCTRLIKGTCVSTKKQAQAFVKELFRFVKTQYDVDIKVLRIDQGYEFGGKALEDFCALMGCELELTDPYSAHQNGVAEATNQKINDAIRSAALDYDLPPEIWPFLYDGVIHILNRMTCRGLLAITPYEAGQRSLNAMEYGQPVVDYLRPLGCRVYVHLEQEQRVKSHKFDARKDIGTLVGFAGTHQYRVWIPRRKQIITSSSVDFDTRSPEMWNLDPTSALGGDDPLSTLQNLEVVEESLLDESLSNLDKDLIDVDPQVDKDDTIIVQTSHDQKNIKDQEEARKDYKKARARVSANKRKKHTMQRRVTPKRHKVTDIAPKRRIRLPAPDGPKTTDFSSMPERPKRSRNTPVRYRQLEHEVEAEADSVQSFLTRLLDGDFIPSSLPKEKLPQYTRSVQAFVAKTKADPREPTTYIGAIKSPNSQSWKTAMEKELNSLEENHTGDLVTQTPNMHVLEGKWVYKLKVDQNGNIIKFKARWVVKGFEQYYGTEYDQTFAGVAKGMTIKALFALAAQYDLEIEQMDVVTAFLNGDIDCELYVEYPEGFKCDNKVWKLRKALYGLKQSPRLWQEKLRTALAKFGYKPLQADHCLYRNPDTGIIICTYVDDFLLFGHDKAAIEVLKQQLFSTFKMESLGPCSYFLGMRITRDRDRGRINICQDAYIDRVAKRFDLAEGDTCTTPVDASQLVNLVSSKEQATPQEITRYQQAIGSMMYAMLQTRPDIAFTVSILSRFNANPSATHWRYALETIKYLAGTRTLGITYSRNDSGRLEIHAFSDSDHAGCRETLKSTTGYVFMMASGAVSWRSRRQAPRGLSSMEAEYYALTETAREATWLRLLLSELSYEKADLHPTRIFGDNIPSQILAKNPEYHGRSKHIKVQYHYIREEVLTGNVVIHYIPTELMTADGLTKLLTPTSFAKFVELLNLDNWNMQWADPLTDLQGGARDMMEEQEEYIDIRMQQPPTILAKPELEDEVNTFLDELERGVMMD